MVKTINKSREGGGRHPETPGQPEAPRVEASKALRKRRCHENYKFIGIEKRIDVIYENFLHDR